MKRTVFILAIILIVRFECDGQSREFNDELITVDVTKSYSQKKELMLQDFMDVEYIALETNDDFLNQGYVMDVGKKFILVINEIDDGDIFVYDRSGKALRKINNKGQQLSREYIKILGITLDEDNNEMFVNDIFTKTILVYDLYGKFKRSFKYKEGTKYQYYQTIYNYDKNNLICFFEDKDTRRDFILISKKNGSVSHEMKIPFKEYLTFVYNEAKDTKKVASNNSYISSSSVIATITTVRTINMFSPRYESILAYNDNWLIIEPSSDTIYSFLPNYQLCPLIVGTPPVHSMKQRIHLVLHNYTDRYYFMRAIKYEKNFSGYNLLYDKQEKDFFTYAVYNDDYATKKEISLYFQGNQEISWKSINAFQLVDDYKKGALKDGKLKEIASKLDEEDNAVIMLVKRKK